MYIHLHTLSASKLHERHYNKSELTARISSLTSQKTLPSLDPLTQPLFSKLESSTVFSRSVIHFMREEPPPAVAMYSIELYSYVGLWQLC